MGSKRKVELVPLKQATKLWCKNAKTLKRWAMLGRVLYEIIEDETSQRGIWYIETPSGRYNRVHNNIK